MIRLLLCCLLLGASAIQAQSVQFYKETIDFTLSAHHLKVAGIYYFCNESTHNSKGVILYPFPIDTLHYGAIDSINITSNGQAIPYTKIGNKGVRFSMDLKALETRQYAISYRQEFMHNKSEYILLTTQQWRKSLEQVDYRLFVPTELTLKNVSYPPDSTIIKGESKVSYWHKKKFWPQKNMIFEL